MTSQDIIRVAYRKFKQMVFYERTDLFLRSQLAEFECDRNFTSKLDALADVVDRSDTSNSESFKSWLGEISYRLVPKSMLQENKSQVGNFFSNLTTLDRYEVDRVNYFFSGPIELHLIAILWIMIQGRILDQQLTNDCYGSRLYHDVGTYGDKSLRLFRKYHDLYSEWRDAGIRKAKQLLTEDKRSVYILGLDITSYYYCIRLNFDDIRNTVKENSSDDGMDYDFSAEDIGENLLRCIESICRTYRKKIERSLLETHPDVTKTDVGIPIGLCSSPLLANWHLHDFDHAVRENIRPAYYGRYVDDILMVIPSDRHPGKDAVSNFIERTLVQTGVLDSLKDGLLQIACKDNLCLQQSKCILQHFDSEHSIAGLDKFKKKLEENASGFSLLPVEGEDGPLEEVAYDLLYSGSTNKFRSVKGVAENRFELAKHLARQTMVHLLTDDPPDANAVRGVQQFFRGRNAIEFHDLWERVFTFFVVIGDRRAADEFEKLLKEEIKRLLYKNEKKLSKTGASLRRNLRRHLSLSRNLAESLDSAQNESLVKDSMNRDGRSYNIWRESNMIRHHVIPYPLLNYSDYQGSLIRPRFIQKVHIDDRKFDLSPRYLHFDELMMFVSSEVLKFNNEPLFTSARNLFEKANGFELQGIEYQEHLEGTDK